MPDEHVERERQHGAERGAGRHAERKRRCQRVSKQRLQDDARRGQRRSHEGACEHARQPRDEENLRVGVVCERHRRIEDAPEVDRRRAHERRQKADDHRGRAEEQPGRPRCVARCSCARRLGCPRHGNHGDVTRSGICRDVDVDAVQLPNERGFQHRLRSRRRPGRARDAAEPGRGRVPLQDSDRASRRRSSGSARDSASGESSESRAGRRDRATPSARREGECAGFSGRARRAMTTRCFSPPDSVLNSRDARWSVPVARSASRAISRSSGPSISNAPRCGYRPIIAISSTVYSKASCVSCGTIAMRRATVARGIVCRSTPSSRTRPLEGRSRPPSNRSSVVLPEPFGPRMPTRPPRGMRALTPLSTSWMSRITRTRRAFGGEPRLTHRAPDLRRRSRCWWRVPARAHAADARTPGTT